LSPVSPATNASISIIQPSRASIPQPSAPFPSPVTEPEKCPPIWKSTKARNLFNQGPSRCICPTDRAVRIAVATNEHGCISKARLHETTWNIRRRNTVHNYPEHDSSLPYVETLVCQLAVLLGRRSLSSVSLIAGRSATDDHFTGSRVLPSSG